MIDDGRNPGKFCPLYGSNPPCGRCMWLMRIDAGDAERVGVDAGMCAVAAIGVGMDGPVEAVRLHSLRPKGGRS